MKSVSISNVCRTFPSRRKYASHVVACNDITLDVKTGTLLTVVGPNGSGKTTLLRLLATVFLPDSGTILINGHNAVKDPMRARASISFVTSEHRNFYARLTGRQNLAFFARLYNLTSVSAKRKITMLADQLGLTDYLDCKFQEYSSGIKQRFHIARGLLYDAPILLLDEPVKHLDPIVADKIRLYIKRELVIKERKTVIMTSHLLSAAAGIADAVAVIKDGTLKAHGTLDELRQKTSEDKKDLDDLYRYYILS